MSLHLTLTPALAGSLAVFAFAASITPGPNNTMLLASGANFGFRRSLPHAAGVLGGFVALLTFCGAGLSGVFRAVPALHAVLKWGGAAYLLWLAFRIAASRGIGAGRAGAAPMSARAAAAFQAVNPKAWAMALGVAAAYLPAGYTLADLAVGVLIVAAINWPCILVWMGSGVGLRRILDRPAVLRAFNLTMAVLLVLSLVPLLLERE